MKSVQHPAIQHRPIALVSSITASQEVESRQTMLFGVAAYLVWNVAWYSVLRDVLHYIH